MKKQIAMKSFTGGNGAFQEGIESLKTACTAARRALEGAESGFGPVVLMEKISHDPTGRADGDWDLDLRLGMVLSLQATHSWVAPKVECRIQPGRLEYTTGSGLIFGWERWDDQPGYTFWVKHPTGSFPYNSSLRPALEKEGWRINSYDESGFVRTESSLMFISGQRVEELAGVEKVDLDFDRSRWRSWWDKVLGCNLQLDGRFGRGYDLGRISLLVEELQGCRSQLISDEKIIREVLATTVHGLTLRAEGWLCLRIDGRPIGVLGDREKFDLIGLWPEKDPESGAVGRGMSLRQIDEMIASLQEAMKIIAENEIGYGMLFTVLEITRMPICYGTAVRGGYGEELFSLDGKVFRVESRPNLDADTRIIGDFVGNS
jgi:hypothetical protein